ncbi:MAG: phosphatase PAP2 family protein [Eubacteriales bacterium]
MESFFEWEYRLLMFLQNSIRGPVQNKIMWCITSLENAGFLSIAACLALLLQPRYRRVGQAATVSMILEFMLVNLVLKNWVARVRPYHLLEDLILLAREPMDYSFPSGHTGAAFAVASVMFIGMPKQIGIPALLVATLIGFSRIYLGVHFPTDVLGGVIVGCLTGFVAWKLTGLKFR